MTLGSRSCIDHFIANESAVRVGECVSTFMDGNNLTEHLLIFITSALTANPSPTEKFLQPSVDWGKVSSTDIDNYKAFIVFT